MTSDFCTVNRTNARSLKKDSTASKRLQDETGSLVLVCSVKAGVNLKAVFMPIKIGFMEISRSRFKQSKISLLKTETNVIGCFVNF